MKPRGEFELGDDDGAGAPLSVSDFTRRVKELLERGIKPCWVRGELSNLRQQASGHVYFSLKDAGAQLSAVMFRGDAVRQSVAWRDGMQVVVFGEVSVYEARGNYQLIVRVLVEDGVGKLQKEFEALKKRLAEEGLFAAENKIALPLLPRTIGFVTSPTGAAVQDFIRILERRGWRGRLVVLPAKVQGQGAAAEMAEMLRMAEELIFFDLLVIGRGGGSLEDLWAFNEEVLVRAVAACRVPIISAVGHEIDFTLCDFAADVRAETPSGAAELITSGFIDCVERVEATREKITASLDLALERAQAGLRHVASRLGAVAPSSRIEQGFLRLDDLGNRLGAACRDELQRRRQRLGEAAGALRERSPSRRVEMESQRLLSLWKRLQAASPQSVLSRGFAIVRDAEGKPVQTAAAAAGQAALALEFADGKVRVRGV